MNNFICLVFVDLIHKGLNLTREHFYLTKSIYDQLDVSSLLAGNVSLFPNSTKFKGISVISKRKTFFTSLLRLVQDRQNHVLKLCYIIYVLSNSVPGVSSRISSGQIKHWSVSSIILSPALKSWVATSPLVGPDPFIFNPLWTKHELSSKKSHFSSFKRASFSSSCSNSSDSVSWPEFSRISTHYKRLIGSVRWTLAWTKDWPKNWPQN